MAKKRLRSIESVVSRQREKHHPSVCPIKGMFGVNCRNCDSSIAPDTRTRKREESSK